MAGASPGLQQPIPVLPRPRLLALHSEVLAHPLTTVVAGAGYGKSTLVRMWEDEGRVAVLPLGESHRSVGVLAREMVDALRVRVPGLAREIPTGVGPEAEEVARATAVASFLAESLRRRLTHPLALVLDDLHELDGSESLHLVEALVRQAPSQLRLVLTGRRPPPFATARLRGRGSVLELGADLLAFTPEEVAELTGQVFERVDGELALTVHRVTGGWPVAVRLALEAVRGQPPERRHPVLERAGRPGSPLFGYLAEEVFGSETPEDRRLLAALEPFDSAAPALLEFLGFERSGEALPRLGRRGTFLEPRDDAWALTPLARGFLAEHAPLDPEERNRLLSGAVSWFEAQRRWREALSCAVGLADPDPIVALLEGAGHQILAAGHARALIQAVESLPARHRSAAVRRIAGEARQVLGDWDGALADFEAITPPQGPIDAGLAWRLGLIHHMRGDLATAMGVYGRAGFEGSTDADAALLHGWWASAVWITGDREGCRALVEQAGVEAGRSGDHRALANVETVRAMLAALDGDRRANEAHYLRALDHAERAGDVLQMVRIHVNRGSRHLEEAAYQEAIEELEVALRLTDLSGFAVFRALGLVNRGHAHLRIGQLDRAAADYGEGRALYERLGSRMAAYAWSGLGDVHRLRGDHALARGAYEEARRLTGATGDLQGLVPALSGLALVVAAEDPGAALGHARAAVEAGPVLGHVGALNALAAVLAAAGSTTEAAATAAQAGAVARERRDRAGLAEALEIEARARPERAPALLGEAQRVWEAVGDPIGGARTELALARLQDEPDPEVLESITARLRRAGARRLAAEAQELVEAAGARRRPEVTIRTLGGFEVIVAGTPVPLGAWQSKKARDVLKILVARRGKPIHREMLVDLLWPDDDPAKTANRLSVALSVVRNVLDPDHRFDQDHYLDADRTTVALPPGRVAVDVERFLGDVAAGRETLRAGRTDEARRLLERAEAAYLGDFLEEDPYEDWAVALREEARNAYLMAAHSLAEQAERTRDAELAATLFLRILERDPYDEPAHLGVVRLMAELGRYGEAHRLYRQYCSRMAEIEVEAAPFPRR